MKSNAPAIHTDSPTLARLEIAHVLFMDLVGYSMVPMDQQTRLLQDLQDIVKQTSEFQKATSREELITLPTGDGMALVFFGSPEDPVLCAMQIARELRSHPELKLRMGIHSGPVYRVEDINASLNVSGGGINIAQRVMDCGDAGHILLSDTTTHTLQQLSTWKTNLHDLGETVVKHGTKLRVYNLFTDGIGNSELPVKLRPERLRRRREFAIGRLIAIASLRNRNITRAAGWVFPVLLGAILAAGALTYRYAPRIRFADVSFPSRPSVALLGFANVSGRSDTAYISTALAQGIGSELGASTRLRIITSEDIARARVELRVVQTSTLGSDLVARLRRNLGADYVVLGSYTALGPSQGSQLRIDLRVLNAASGEPVGWVSRSGTEGELLSLIEATASDLRRRFGVENNTATGTPSGQRSLPGSYEARRLYSEGVDALLRWDARTARDLFERSIVVEPDFPLAHARLSSAWSLLGYDQQAQREAAAAIKLAGGLPTEERRSIEAQYHEMSRDWSAAIEQYLTLQREFPDNPEYGIALASAQTQAGQAKAALTTLGDLKRRPDTNGVDPRIFIEEATAAEALGDTKGQKAAADAAIQSAESRNAPVLVARAYLARALALEHSGELPLAIEANERARLLYQQAGDGRGVARALIQLGVARRRKGDVVEAERNLRAALVISRDMGNNTHIAQALNNLASLFFNRGAFQDAAAMYQESLTVSREVADRVGEARALGNLASVLYEEGRVGEALRLQGESLAVKRQTGNRRAVAFTLTNMAETALDLGRIDSAASMYGEARDIDRSLGDQPELSYALSGLARVALERDNPEEAARLDHDVVAIRSRLNQSSLLADANVDLGRVMLEQHDHQGAAELLQRILDQSASDVDVDTRAKARVLLTETLLRQGRLDAARETFSHLSDDERKAQKLSSRFLTQIVEGRLAAATGDAQSARALFTATRKRAMSVGIKLYERYAELALVETAPDRNSQSVRRDALALYRTAKSDGFALIARRAQSLAH